MRATDRLKLTDQIGRELQNRYGYAEIDEFFKAYAIEPPKDITVNSKWIYAKAALANVSEALLLEIAAELDLAFQGVILSNVRHQKIGQALCSCVSS